MEFITIERGSPSWDFMANAILTGHTLRISRVDETQVKMKANEGMWTPPLETPAAQEHRG